MKHEYHVKVSCSEYPGIKVLEGFHVWGEVSAEIRHLKLGEITFPPYLNRGTGNRSAVTCTISDIFHLHFPESVREMV